MHKLHTRYIAEFVKIALGIPTNHAKHCFFEGPAKTVFSDMTKHSLRQINLTSLSPEFKSVYRCRICMEILSSFGK